LRLPRFLAAATAAVILALAAALPANAERAGSAVRPHQAGWLDAGANHSCAILAAGTIRCWGWNGLGALGYGNTTTIGDDEAPAAAGAVNLGPGRTATQVAVGYLHSCAILDTGGVTCWGYSDYGQLGYGNTTTIGDNEAPAAAGTVNLGGRTAIAITAGYEHTCVIVSGGDVMCWGRGDRGQLGYGNTNDIGDNETPASAGLVNLGGEDAVAISAGTAFTCAVTSVGSVRCWGWGAGGRTGQGHSGSVGDDETPGSVPPVDLGGMTARAVSAGQMHACALGDTGAVRCWGDASNGQLGYGNTTGIGDDESPAVAGTVATGGTATAISAGEASTCAVMVSGAVQCWGWNAAGALGRGTTTRVGDDETPASVGAVTLGTSAARAVDIGLMHACAFRDDDTVWCWGSGTNGRAGHGNTTPVGDDETLTAGNAAVDLGGPVVANVADLSLGVSPASPTANVGQDLTVTLTLVNDGPDTAATPTVDVDLTGAPTVVSAVGTGGFGFGSWSPGNLASGQTATMTLVLRPTAAGTLAITADLDGTGTWDPDSTPGNTAPSEDDHAAATVTVATAPPPPPSAPAPSDPAPADPAPSEPAPADPAPRVAPRGLTLDAARARGGRAVVVTGRLRAPAGARGTCAGSVRITVTAGRRTAATAVASLRTTGTACAYTARLPLAARSGAVTVSARFLGNDDLLPQAARSRTLRAR